MNVDGLASLEYGVAVLNIPLLMVLGHTNRGAIDAAIKVVKDKTKLPGHLPQLICELKPAVDVALKARAGCPVGRDHRQCAARHQGAAAPARSSAAARPTSSRSSAASTTWRPARSAFFELAIRGRRPSLTVVAPARKRIV